MGGGNGCKSATSRARNEKNAAKPAKSILKDKATMMSLQCAVCKVSGLHR